MQLYQADPKVGERQRQKLAQVRDRRDDAKVKKTLARVAEAAYGNENMMLSISEAVKAYASMRLTPRALWDLPGAGRALIPGEALSDGAASSRVDRKTWA